MLISGVSALMFVFLMVSLDSIWCLSEYPDILSVAMGLVLIWHGLLLGLSDCKAVGAILSVVWLFDGCLLSVANCPGMGVVLHHVDERKPPPVS